LLNVAGVQGDVSNLGDLDRLFARIKQDKGRLDVLFANAGVAKLAPFGTGIELFVDGGLAKARFDTAGLPGGTASPVRSCHQLGVVTS
jgi:NAD(P)-dependent dehydrogenase (short-subunit alcohol dehydrogenase family)